MADEQTTEAVEETPESEAVEAEEVVDEEAVEEPAGEAEGEETAEETPEPEAADPFADFGGREQVESAYRVWERLGTEDGVLDMFISTAKALELPLDKVEALFAGETPAPAEPEEERDPDEPITRAEFEKAIADAVRQATQPLEEDQTKRAQAAVRDAVQREFEAAGLNDPVDQDRVLALADRYVTADNYLDPEVAKNAVRKAAEDFKQAVEAKAKEYLKGKLKTKKTVPSSTSASTPPGGEEEKKDFSFEEGIARARKRLSEQR